MAIHGQVDDTQKTNTEMTVFEEIAINLRIIAEQICEENEIDYDKYRTELERELTS